MTKKIIDSFVKAKFSLKDEYVKAPVRTVWKLQK